MTKEQYLARLPQIEAAMVQSYYNKQAPFGGEPGFIPTVPVDEDGNQLFSKEEVPFKYVEVEFENGNKYLAIITPFKVSNGPGRTLIGTYIKK